MSSKLSTEILINLTGNLTAKARQYGANMSEFARRNERAMTVVRATTAAAGRAMDGLQNRYTGMVAGFATGITVKGVADFDAQMRRMATDAQLTKGQMSDLHEKIRDVSNQPDIRIDASSLASGANELLGKAGDYQFVTENLRNMGLAMQAFGIDGETAAGLLAQFHEKGVTGTEDVSNALDRLNAQFAIGSVSVRDIAKVAPKLFSTILNQGPGAIAQMGALAQVFAKNKGSAEETVTSIQAVYASLTDKKNIKFLKGAGIDVFQKGTKEMKLPYELLKEVLERAKFDPQKLQDVFDQTGMQGLTSLLKPENLAMLDKMIYGQVELGSTQKSSKLNAEGFNSALQSLNNELQRFAESNLAGPVQELADMLNSVDHETAQNWLEVGKNIAIVTGGVIAARKAFQLGKGAMDLFGIGKGKGLPKDVSDTFGSGVMPVYVVNMGTGGMGNGDKGDSGNIVSDVLGDIGDALGESGNRRLLRIGNIMKVVASSVNLASIGQDIYENYFPKNDDEKKVFFQKVKENTERPTMWNDIKDWFTSTSNDPQIANPTPWANFQNQTPAYPSVPQQLKGEIRVVVEGDARVKSVKMDQPGITLSAQSGVSNVEQN